MGSAVTEEQERVRVLLSDTIKLLCKNGLSYKQNMTIQGLIGITLDKDVFLVHLDENFQGELSECADSTDRAMSPGLDPLSLCGASSRSPKSPKRKRRRSTDHPSKHKKDSDAFRAEQSEVLIKTEPEDDIIFVEDAKIRGHSQSRSNCDSRTNYSLDSSMGSFQQGTSGGSTSAAGGPQSAGDSFHTPYHLSPASAQSQGLAMSGPFIAGVAANQMSGGPGGESSDGAFPWDGGPPGLASWASQLPSQTMSSPNAVETSANQSPGGGQSAGGKTKTRCLSVKFLSGVDCIVCQQLVRRVKHRTHRAKYIKQGVPPSTLPDFTEQTMKPNTNCMYCLERTEYERNKKRKWRHARQIGKKLNFL